MVGAMFVYTYAHMHTTHTLLLLLQLLLVREEYHPRDHTLLRDRDKEALRIDLHPRFYFGFGAHMSAFCFA